MRFKVNNNNSFQEVVLGVANLKMRKDSGGNARLSGEDPKNEKVTCSIDIDADEMRILAIDFLDALKETEAQARSGVAKSYRRKLAREV